MKLSGKLRRLVAGLLLAVLGAGAAHAHHPGHKLDEVMGSREHFFQVVDKVAPAFSLRDAGGREVTLAGLRGKVAVLFFVYASCTDVCPLHAEKIAEVQSMINQSAMKGMVRFVAVTTDPANDTPAVMREYGPAHGLDAVNWTFLTAPSGAAEDATRKLAESYGHKFTKTAEGDQMHGIVTHVIDKTGRWRANFHGLRFSPLNLVLYINGLTHEAVPPERGR